MKEIQFVDLLAQYQSIKTKIDQSIADVINRSLFIRGPYVESFESKFAELLGLQHCVSCANGTDSLYIAMKSLKVKEGDEVICPAHSWISTSETITQAGGRVVFCDTNLDTFTLDPDKLEALISERTVGIIPVHMFGQPADMDPILEVARRHGLWVIEDCAQAHLSEYRGVKVGTLGNVGSFSFYPGKNLGAMGDAGGIVTNDDNLAKKMAMFARHGGLTKGQHEIEGINSRMDGLQAAVLTVKCEYIEQWTKQRQTIAEYYLEHVDNPKIHLPTVADYSTHVWHLFVVKCDQRDELQEYLRDRGIPTVVNYPLALPFLPAYRAQGGTKDMYPNAYYNQSRILSIPIYPELQQDQIDHIVSSLNLF